MSYDILELDNCFLVADRPRNGSCVSINGSRITNDDARWYQRVVFLSSLPNGTWGSVVTFVKDNEDQLRRCGITRIDDILTVTGAALTKQVLRVSRIPDGNTRSSGSSFLFTPVDQDPAAKRHYKYDGVDQQADIPVDGRSRATKVYVFETSYCQAMDSSQPVVEEEHHTSSEVMNYTYKPEYKFMAMPKEQTECYFGLELEVNSKVPWSDIHRAMTSMVPVQEAFIFAKQDGSISGQFNKCYEIVSHPMSPRRMRVEFTTLFKKLERLVADKGLEWKEVFDMETTTTGIHVHVSKGSFTPLSRTHKKKFMMLWNNSSPAISDFTAKLACRTLKGNTYVKPASDYAGRSLAWMLKEGKNSDRHSSCNETTSTVEVRAFRGQPSLASVRHAIDTTEAMLRFTEQMPNSQLNRHFPRHFKAWLGKQNKNSYRNLKMTLANQTESPKVTTTATSSVTTTVDTPYSPVPW
jgi:hypothetical protein